MEEPKKIKYVSRKRGGWDNRKKTHEQFCEEMKQVYGDEYTVTTQYIRAKDKIGIRHNVCGHEWSPVANSILHKNSGCPKCSKVYRMSDKEYREKLAINNPNLECMAEFIGLEKKTPHKCKICNYTWDVQPYSVVTGKTGCPMCHGGTNTVVVGVNDMWTTNPELAKLLADPNDGYRYTQASTAKTNWKCPDCDEITKKIAIGKVKSRGFSCKRCSLDRSLPNRTMYNLLSQLNIDFEDEKYFKWCRFNLHDKQRKGIYDFYFTLENKQYVIEMDGFFHKNTNHMNGFTVEDALFIDSEKDRLAKEHNINIIRIECIPSTVNVIKNNILNSELSTLFDLTNVNWNECFYKSANPIIKDTWRLFNNGMSVREIAEHYQKDVATIMKYLDYGTELGECKYEHTGNVRKIVCLNDGNILNSLQDALRKYGGSQASIQKCCDGNSSHAGRMKEKDTDIPLVFADYDKYINMSEQDKLYAIQRAVIDVYKDTLVVCKNTKYIFPTMSRAIEWCGTDISGNLYNPELNSYSGKHPITNEKLQWIKLKDYIDLESALSYLELSAFSNMEE